MKRKTTMSLLIVMLCTLMGCGRKDVDYTETKEAASEEVSAETIVTETETIEIPENLEYTITGTKSEIQISAEVKVPKDYERCTVMELSRIVYEDEDIKRIADEIFDEGSYFLYMPYNEEARAVLRDKLTTASENAANDWDAATFEYVLNSFDKEDFYTYSKENFEEIKFYPDHRYEGELYFCMLCGTVEGRYYILTFQKDDKNCDMNLLRWDRMIIYSQYDVNPEGPDVATSENESIFSQEESETMAKEFVKKLGYGDFDMVQTNSVYISCALPENARAIKREESYMAYEGYNVYFGRSYNNYAMMYYAKLWVMGLKGTESEDAPVGYDLEKFNNTECVRVYVDSQGICEVRVYNPMEEVGPMNKEIVFLSFDKVDSIARDELQVYADEKAEEGKLKVESVELAYGIIDEDGKKALIPVWYYMGRSAWNNDDMYKKEALVMINALDGTVIDYK